MNSAANQDARLSMTNDNANGTEFRIGETRDVGQWRIWRGMHNVKATHIANAGKRGKQCEIVVAMGVPDFLQEQLCKVLITIGEISALDSTNSQATPDHVFWVLSRFTGDGQLFTVARSSLRGVDVATVAPLRFDSAKVRFLFDHEGFSITDLTDHDNEPTLCDRRLSKREGLRLHQWAKDNVCLLCALDFNGVARELRQAGFDYHRYCAID